MVSLNKLQKKKKYSYEFTQIKTKNQQTNNLKSCSDSAEISFIFITYCHLILRFMTGTFQYFREKKSWNKVILYTMTNHLF